MERTLRWLAGIFLVVVMFGCNGGGGGGSDLVSFIKWSSIKPPATVVADGISQDGSYTAPGPTYTVTEINDNGVNTNSRATIKYRSNGTIERIAISTPFVKVTWDEASGDLIDDSSEAILAVDRYGTDFAMAINARHPSVPWEYQSFGVWETGRGLGLGSVGAISFGAPTPRSEIPSVDELDFVGLTSGVYLNEEGTMDYFTVSPLTVTVNFVEQELAFVTKDTVKIEMLSGIETDAFNLDMNGLLKYTNQNLFSGDVIADGGLTGKATGQFYGPHAEELGGVFSLSGAGVESYAGGFGAQR